MHSSHPGGDPFSHPSGSSMSRPAWVTDRSAAGRLSSTHSARPPPGLAGARKHSVPTRVHSVGDDLWLARPFRTVRPTCRRLSAWSNHLKISLGHSHRSGLVAGGDQPCPFSPVGSGVQTRSLVHDWSPLNLFSWLVRRRARRRRAHRQPSHARRPWPVCRPAPWSR